MPERGDLGPVGASFLDIFTPGRRPRSPLLGQSAEKSYRWIAGILKMSSEIVRREERGYAVCGGSQGFGPQDGSSCSSERDLSWAKVLVPQVEKDLPSTPTKPF